MRLNIFSNLMAKYPQETSLEDIVRIMRTSKRLKSLCNQRVNHIAAGRKDSADKIKRKQIPAFAPGALLYDGKGRKNVLGLTNLCFLESDHINEDELVKAKELLSKDNHVVLVARSVSGDGIHFLVKYGFKDMEQPSYKNMGINRMNHTYGAVFKSLKNYYEDILKIPLDKSGMNMERLCLISSDSDLYYNPDAFPIYFIYEQQNLNRKPKILSRCPE